MVIILSNLNTGFQNSFTGRISRKHAINDKLQGTGSVATYLRCGWVVNNQIKKGLLLSPGVNFFLNR